MSKYIGEITIKNFLGIVEQTLKAGKVNVIEGPNGHGKSSFGDSIIKGLANINTRKEMLHKGAEEGEIFIRSNDGFEFLRKLKKDNESFVVKDDEGNKISSPQTFTNKFLNYITFKPMEFVNKKPSEQKEIILSLIDYQLSKEDVEKMYGEAPQGIDYSKHGLQVLKDLEKHFFTSRTDINRAVKSLKNEIESLKQDLPVGVDWDKIENTKLKDIVEQLNILTNTKEKLNSFDKEISEIKANSKIENIKDQIAQTKEQIENKNKEFDKEFAKIKERIENKVNTEIEEIDSDIRYHEQQIIKLKEQRDNKKKNLKSNIEQEQKLFSEQNKSKILELNQELKSLAKELEETKTNNENKINDLKEQKEKILKEYPEIEISIRSKQDELSKLEYNKSKLELHKLIERKEHEFKEYNEHADKLTNLINNIREKPTQIIKNAELPVDSIEINDEEEILINGLPIDNLSTGEKLTLSFEIARHTASEFKIIILDDFEHLSKENRDKILLEAEKDDFQYFILKVSD